MDRQLDDDGAVAVEPGHPGLAEDDAPVADPMFQKAKQPVLADFVEGSGDRLPIAAMSQIR